MVFDPRIDDLDQKLDKLITLNLSQHSRSSLVGSTPSHSAVIEVCALCSESSHEATSYRYAHEYPQYMQVNVCVAQGYTREYNPYPNNHNSGWRDNSKLSWRHSQYEHVPPDQQPFQ